MKQIVISFVPALLLLTNAFSAPLILHNIQVSEQNINEIKKMTENEREYLFNRLGKIRKGMSRDEVIAILGTPSRNLPQKVNW
jgi:outer membrane protein assembly factor BamE (lipoprotein component of BamABCDE complex)